MPTKRRRSPTPPASTSGTEKTPRVDSESPPKVSERHQRPLPPPSESAPPSPDSSGLSEVPERSAATSSAPESSNSQPTTSKETLSLLMQQLTSPKRAPYFTFTRDSLEAGTDRIAMANLQQFLKVDTQVSTMGSKELTACYAVISKITKELKNAEIDDYVFEDNAGIIVVRVTGIGDNEKKLPAILLNAHIDVPNCRNKKWNRPPFGAEFDTLGIIYARGIQNGKTNAIQYLETMKRLQVQGIRLKRNVYIMIGTEGYRGVGRFLTLPIFKTWNIGFVLDAGIPSTEEEFIISNHEKSTWHVEVICSTTAVSRGAHEDPDDTPAEKLRIFLNKILDFRDSEKKKLKEHPELEDIITIYLTKVQGSTKSHVIAAKIVATFDIRFPLNYNQVAFERQLDHWAKETDVQLNYLLKQGNLPKTTVDPEDALFKAINYNSHKYKVETIQTTLNTHYFRSMGLPTFGFSPINKTEKRTHLVDECLNVYTFLRGITIYSLIVKTLDKDGF